jgi:hypothetical protein
MQNFFKIYFHHLTMTKLQNSEHIFFMITYILGITTPYHIIPHYKPSDTHAAHIVQHV